MVAPQVRLELTTLRLTAECSAIELLRIILPSFGASLLSVWLACLASLALAFLRFVWEREKLPFLPLPVDPGNFLLSQAVPSPVPSAFGGLTSVFGMGTGGALQLSSPETFRRGAFPLPVRFALCFRVAHSPLSSLPLPAPSKLHRSELTSKLTLSFVFLGSSPRPISIGKLHASQRFHRRPIYLIVSEGSYLLYAVAVFFFRGASRLDAFSVYPVRTSLPSCAFGKTTVAPEVRPSRSSRTRDSSRHDSCAHDG